MKRLFWKITKWLLGRVVPKREPVPKDFPGLEDWLEATFAYSATRAGLDFDNLTDQQKVRLREAYDVSTSKIAELLTEKLVEGWKAQSKRELKREDRYRRGFESRLLRIWHEAITALEMLRSVSLTIGTEFNETHRQKAANEKDFVFDALTRLHAHACMIVAEIIVMLRHGFASGAYSRWRTLHEIVVVAYFILHNGNDVAERFLLYDHIESWRAAREYREKFEKHRTFFESGGHEIIDDALMSELEETRNELCARFGKVYENYYGWAANALADKAPTFKKIEEAANLDNMRPFYRLASYSVHAEPKGILRTLGQSLSDSGKPTHERAMIAGPSIFGLADPGQGAAITLFQVTFALLSWKGGLSEEVYGRALEKLCADVVDTFIRINDETEERNAQELQELQDKPNT